MALVRMVELRVAVAVATVREKKTTPQTMATVRLVSPFAYCLLAQRRLSEIYKLLK